MTANALAFQLKFQDLIERAPAPSVAWKKIGYSVSEVEFDSLVKREGGHPADKVRGFVYFPNSYKTCDVSFPATLLIHKLGDKLDDEKQIAEFAARSDRGVVMLIYLPHFGPRKRSEPFITKAPEDFELNILQSLADIHQSYRILKSLPRVKPNDIGLMGLSLGGMITLVSAGIDPVFDRYAANVGGGDLANIVTYRKSGDVDSQTGSVLKDIDWSVDQARFFLSRFDAITWSLRLGGLQSPLHRAQGDARLPRQRSRLLGFPHQGHAAHDQLHRPGQLRRPDLPPEPVGPSRWEGPPCENQEVALHSYREPTSAARPGGHS